LACQGYATAPTITDMTVNPASTATDFITLSASAANYAGNATGAGGWKATTTAQGSVIVQGFAASSGANAITSAASEIIKFTTGVVTTGLTLQQAYNTAIGGTQITGTSVNGSYFFMMYDITNSKMMIGMVQETSGAVGVIATNDTVALLGTANMTAADYANINTNHFSIIAA
jgi:hypothetical protein